MKAAYNRASTDASQAVFDLVSSSNASIVCLVLLERSQHTRRRWP
jgi:hypothetical protein